MSTANRLNQSSVTQVYPKWMVRLNELMCALDYFSRKLISAGQHAASAVLVHRPAVFYYNISVLPFVPVLSVTYCDISVTFARK